ncbi:hypothetical protein IFR05_002748 [Cadophora sp. M221]|nr:hypothetical protein IFR05_002748 [Cadophora sp. M221]
MLSTTITLVLNGIFAIIVLSYPGDRTSKLLLEGSCASTDRFNAVIHIAINILGMVILASSSYCMQILTAPTRADIDKAHSQFIRLDIGVSSVRNLRHLPWVRAFLWCCIVLTSIPIHLFYNSIVFSGVKINQYAILSVTSSFMDENALKSVDWAGFNTTGPKFTTALNPNRKIISEMHQQLYSGNYTKLDELDCVDAYAPQLQTGHGNVILVSNVTGKLPIKTLQYSDLKSSVYETAWGYTFDTSGWICGAENATTVLQNGGYWSAAEECNSDKHAYYGTSTHSWLPFGTKVDYCLAQNVVPQCKVFASLSLIFLVLMMGLLKLVVMAVAFFHIDSAPLLTLGDAIASFMENADQYTRNMCLCSSENFRIWAYKNTEWTPQLRPWVKKTRRWYSMIRVRRWILSWSLLLLTVPYTIFIGFYSPSGLGAWRKGLGALDFQTVIGHSFLQNKGSIEIVVMILIANLPQVMLSLAYFAYNNIFTCMLQDVEWHGFSTTRKPLRVSGSRRGSQRSTYFLHLPYRFAIPLAILSGILHWLASQSLFLVYIQYSLFPICETTFTDCSGLTDAEALEPHHYTASQFQKVGLDPSYSEIVSCGFSVFGTLAVMALALFLLFGAGVTGRRQLGDKGQPVVGSCSAAIAAACHSVGTSEKADASEKPLKWGVTFADAEAEIGHCGLSSGEVGDIDVAYLYSGSLISTLQQGHS